MVDSVSKLSCKNGYLVVHGESIKMIHLGEIDTLMLSTTQATITAYTLCELAKNKIRVVFCDEKKNPYGELCPYYGQYNSSKKIALQNTWTKQLKFEAFKKIIFVKINNQAKVLERNGFLLQANELKKMSEDILPGDESNREGLAAKAYFRSLFGSDFTRELNSSINTALNYGYAILLSAINREVILNGCLTQIGIKHNNEYNYFNLSCDLIEPFRPIVDEYVFLHKNEGFSAEIKLDLVTLTAKKVKYDGQEVILSYAIKKAVKSVIDALNNDALTDMKLYEL